MNIKITHWIFVATVILFVTNGKCEVFLGSSTSVNSLVVASNEVLLISSLKIGGDNPSFLGQINVMGNIQTSGFDGDSSLWGEPLALAGPATLIFPDTNTGTNSLPVCFCFNRLTGTTIKSVLVPNASSPQINVPAGQTCKLFRPICINAAGYTHIYAQVNNGTNTVSQVQLEGGEEYSGPISISLTNLSGLGGIPPCAIVSYFMTDDSVSLPSGVVQGGTGAFVITVEKSSDLTDWSPVMIQPVANDQKAFYRLKFSN